MHSSAAFSRLDRTDPSSFSPKGLDRCAAGGGQPVRCSTNWLFGFVDGGAGFGEPAVCAFAAEGTTRAGNAINVPMMGLPTWGPPLTIMTMVSPIARRGKPPVLLRCSTVGQPGVSPLRLPGCERARPYGGLKFRMRNVLRCQFIGLRQTLLLQVSSSDPGPTRR